MIDFNVAITAVKNNNGFRPNDYDDSFYRPYILTGKKIIQARISGHGTHLWSWVKNSEYNPKDCMGNICVVFSPNGAFQCSTFVKASKYRNAKTNPSGKPYDFTVIQYVYDCSRITQYDLDLINKSIKDIPISGKYEDPLKDEVKKHAGIYELHPNQGIKTIVKPYVKDESIPSKIDRFEGDDYYTMLRHYREWNGQMYESKNYKNMKKKVQRINESQLRAIVAESVKKVLNEGEGGLLTVGELKSILSECNDDDFVAFVPEESRNAYRCLVNYSIGGFRWNAYEDYDGRDSLNLIMKRG